MLLNFLVIIVFVFILSSLVLMLAVSPPLPDPQTQAHQPDDAEQHLEPEEMEEMVELIDRDKELLAPAPPVEVPRIDLPGAKLGGGAMDEDCSKATGTIVLRSDEDPNEKRKYNRRLRDRRLADAAPGTERRMVQRRVWLRREEDCRGKNLLTVADAADTLGVPIEQIYKWLDASDIPFYKVTEGKRKAIRFEVNELLQWYSTFTVGGGDLPKET